MHLYLCVCVYVCVPMHTCMYACAFKHPYVYCVCAHMDICTCITFSKNKLWS